ncbi:unknown protein [Seminavis robusta]|uniref:Uncharacterized protein n=1 Tax=Seminavis robusta TaxID=568900 RepID=A0A9N8DTQ5_9STRA|nr:unknown protein [Seminavis robusta]|eukprot:Sro350_g123760.1 n/a (824) ;mRNA; f:56011-59119
MAEAMKNDTTTINNMMNTPIENAANNNINKPKMPIIFNNLNDAVAVLLATLVAMSMEKKGQQVKGRKVIMFQPHHKNVDGDMVCVGGAEFPLYNTISTPAQVAARRFVKAVRPLKAATTVVKVTMFQPHHKNVDGDTVCVGGAEFPLYNTISTPAQVAARRLVKAVRPLKAATTTTVVVETVVEDDNDIEDEKMVKTSSAADAYGPGAIVLYIAPSTTVNDQENVVADQQQQQVKAVRPLKAATATSTVVVETVVEDDDDDEEDTVYADLLWQGPNPYIVVNQPVVDIRVFDFTLGGIYKARRTDRTDEKKKDRSRVDADDKWKQHYGDITKGLLTTERKTNKKGYTAFYNPHAQIAFYEDEGDLMDKRRHFLDVIEPAREKNNKDWRDFVLAAYDSLPEDQKSNNWYSQVKHEATKRTQQEADDDMAQLIEAYGEEQLANWKRDDAAKRRVIVKVAAPPQVVEENVPEDMDVDDEEEQQHEPVVVETVVEDDDDDDMADEKMTKTSSATDAYGPGAIVLYIAPIVQKPPQPVETEEENDQQQQVVIEDFEDDDDFSLPSLTDEQEAFLARELAKYLQQQQKEPVVVETVEEDDDEVEVEKMASHDDGYGPGAIVVYMGSDNFNEEQGKPEVEMPTHIDEQPSAEGDADQQPPMADEAQPAPRRSTRPSAAKASRKIAEQAESRRRVAKKTKATANKRSTSTTPKATANKRSTSTTPKATTTKPSTTTTPTTVRRTLRSGRQVSSYRPPLGEELLTLSLFASSPILQSIACRPPLGDDKTQPSPGQAQGFHLEMTQPAASPGQAQGFHLEMTQPAASPGQAQG